MSDTDSRRGGLAGLPLAWRTIGQLLKGHFATDVVTLGDDVTRGAEVIRISRRTLRIA